MFASQVYSQPMTTMVGGSRVVGGFAQPTTMMATAAPTIVTGGVTEIDQVNAFGQVVERDLVVGGAGMTRIAQPTYVSGGFTQPQPTYVSGGFTQPTLMMAAPAVTEIDQVNAYGQVVERDFVVGGGAALGRGIGVPVQSGLNGVARVIGMGATQMVTEIDRVNAYGQVVERDFIGAGGVTQVIGGGVTYGAAPMVTYGAPMMTEVDRVNAYGQVVERDFVSTGAVV